MELNFKKDSYIFIPNEIFDDLGRIKYKSTTHYAFTIAYYTFVSFLYYSEYYRIELVSQQDIKEFIGYNRDNKAVDYIIKKNGLLDLSGYTRTENHMVLFNKKSTELMMYEEEKVINFPKKFSIKYPVKGFYRNIADEEDNDLTGTFFNTYNTTRILIKTIESILKNQKLKYLGLLVYLYIKQNKDLCMSYVEMSNNLHISDREIRNIIRTLEEFGFLFTIHAKYDVSGKNKKANIYTAIEN